MHPDLVVTAYRQQERELEERLRRRRIVLERAATVGPAPAPSRRASRAIVRGAAHRVAATLHRSRRAVADAYAPSDCCATA